MSRVSVVQRSRWRVDSIRRDAERKRLEAKHALLIAKHRRSVARARSHITWYAVGAAGSVVGVGVSHGFARFCWSVALVACVAEVGLWFRKLKARRAAPPPTAPQLPQAVPAPPPRTSASWPALRRLESAVTAIRKLLPALPPDIADIARPSVDAARAAYDMGRAQATQIAATETALTIVPLEERSQIEQVRGQLLSELDLAAEAVEHLLTSCTRLIGARSGSDARGQLSAATAEVVARTYGLQAAALTSTDLDLPG